MDINNGKKLETIDILDALSKLRRSTLKGNEFWEQYLYLISLLTKTPLCFVTKRLDGNLELFYEYNQSNIDEGGKEAIYNSLADVQQRAFAKGYAYERSSYQNRHIVAIALDDIDDTSQYTLYILIENNDKKEFTNTILRTLLCKDIPLFCLYKNETDTTYSNHTEDEDKEGNSLSVIIELIDLVIHEKDFKLSLMKIVDEFANRFNAFRVSVGWEFNQYINPKAISHVEDFLGSSYSAKALEAIYEESYEQDIEIFYPDDHDSNIITNAHHIFMKENKIDNLYSFPIRYEDEIIGVVSFEMKGGALKERDLEVIRLALNILAPILYKTYLYDQNIFKKIFKKIEIGSKKLLGPEKSLMKLSILLTSILFLWMFFGKLEYKVEAVTNLQTDNIAYISAPFDGIVKDVFIDSGDDVLASQKLLSFDDKEMILKQLEINSDIIRFDTEAEKARSQRQLADMQIALAKKKQSEASLKKINYFLEKVDLKSPFDGIIIEGDREKLLGSPFSKGDILIQVAKPTDLYGKLKVEEQFIDEIKLGQIAQLSLLSKPHEYFNVKIEKIIPMANVDNQNGNVFTIKVVFIDEVKPWMRPGMSGVAKIKIEQRTVYWILTHKISDFLHMHVWW